jgi:hypothetical protein
MRDLLEQLRRLTEEDDIPSPDEKPGEWNLMIRKYSGSRWSYFLKNPQGGGGGSGAYSTVKAAVAAGSKAKDWKGKKKIWVVIQKWNGDDYETTKAYWMDVPEKGQEKCAKCGGPITGDNAMFGFCGDCVDKHRKALKGDN